MVDIPEELRKRIFYEMVEAEDSGQTTAQARRVITERFGISEAQLRKIEAEGVEGTWPPLEDCDEDE